jgi:hypothetical protein
MTWTRSSTYVAYSYRPSAHRLRPISSAQVRLIGNFRPASEESQPLQYSATSTYALYEYKCRIPLTLSESSPSVPSQELYVGDALTQPNSRHRPDLGLHRVAYLLRGNVGRDV